MPTLYQTLGLEKGKESNSEEIKKAYHERLKLLPKEVSDLSERDKRKKELDEAYEVLRSKQRKSEYDKLQPVTADLKSSGDSLDLSSISKEILDLQKFYNDFAKSKVGEMDIPAEKGYSSKITGFNEMQANFLSPKQMDEFIEKAAARFPNAGIVQTDANNNKAYKTFSQIMQEKLDKAEKEKKAEQPVAEKKSELASKLLKGVSSTPRPSIGGGGAAK